MQVVVENRDATEKEEKKSGRDYDAQYALPLRIQSLFLWMCIRACIYVNYAVLSIVVAGRAADRYDIPRIEQRMNRQQQ